MRRAPSPPAAPLAAPPAPRSPVAVAALVAAPAVALAVAGLAHPTFLTPETAARWELVHLVLLPLFPLLAGSLLVLLHGDRSPVAHAARVLALAYAVLYSALDAIAGIGAGGQLRLTSERGDPRPPVEDLFTVGDRLGHLGAYALLLAGALTAYALFRRTRRTLVLVGGAAVVVGAQYVNAHHVFPPLGVTGMALVAAGLALMAYAGARPVR